MACNLKLKSDLLLVFFNLICSHLRSRKYYDCQSIKPQVSHKNKNQTKKLSCSELYKMSLTGSSPLHLFVWLQLLTTFWRCWALSKGLMHGWRGNSRHCLPTATCNFKGSTDPNFPKRSSWRQPLKNDPESGQTSWWIYILLNLGRLSGRLVSIVLSKY